MLLNTYSITVTTIPTEVEQNGTIKLQPNEVEEVCNDASKINEVKLQFLLLRSFVL